MTVTTAKYVMGSVVSSVLFSNQRNLKCIDNDRPTFRYQVYISYKTKSSKDRSEIKFLTKIKKIKTKTKKDLLSPYKDSDYLPINDSVYFTI